MIRRDSHDEQLDDAEMAEIYLHHRPRRRVAPTNCYHLARQTQYGPEQYGVETNGETLDVCRRALEALMSDPPEDRDNTLCVVHVPGQWRDAEVVLTAEEVAKPDEKIVDLLEALKQSLAPDTVPPVVRCAGCGALGHDPCGGDHCENGDRA